MGYHTDFYGSFAIDPPLTPEQVAYLKAFNWTRRVARDEDKALMLDDPLRVAVGLPVGLEGSYFVGGGGTRGQKADPSVLDFMKPPGGELTGFVIKTGTTDDGQPFGPPCPLPAPHRHLAVRNPETGWRDEQIPEGHGCQYGVWRKRTGVGQPGLWCQWVPTPGGTRLEWDEGEKFYDYCEWLFYMIAHFFIPWGRILDGEVQWVGEAQGDCGRIIVTNNIMAVSEGSRAFDASDKPRVFTG